MSNHKTRFKCFAGVDNHLCENIPWYKHWHQSKLANFIHILTLLAFIFGSTLYIYALANLSQKAIEPQFAKAQLNNLFINPDFALNNSNWSTKVVTPEYWVLAPGNEATYGTKDFLVMQYEAKAWDTENDEVVAASDISNNSWAGVDGQTRYRAVSMPEGFPWVYIQQNTANYDAIDACVDATQLSGLVSDSTHLITNDEWMTLARNIEAQPQNWADGVVGSTVASGGGLFRGWTGNNDSASYGGSSDPESGTNRNVKARHTLSNGSQIWDLAGNVKEWTSSIIQRKD